MTFVSMELPAFDDESISDLAADDHDENLGALLDHIVENPKVAEPKFVAGQGIGSERLNCPAGTRWLISESGGDSVADDPLLPGRKVLELGLGVVAQDH